MLTLGDLIESSAKVITKNGKGHYSKDELFSEKTFGSIYYSDKAAYYNEHYKILELRMVIGSIDSDKNVHVVRMAFFDVEGDVYTKAQLKKLLGYDKDKEFGVVRKKSDVNAQLSTEASMVSELGGGIIIPCAGAGAKMGNQGEFILPDPDHAKYFYSKTGITTKNLCAVSCSCPSYRYTFAEYNDREQAHLGVKPRKYKNNARKGSDISASKLNVNKVPGLCKHIMLFTLMLISGELLKGYGKIENLHALREDIAKLSYSGSDRSKAKLLSKDKTYTELATSLQKALLRAEADYQKREDILATYRYNIYADKPIKHGNTAESRSKFSTYKQAREGFDYVDEKPSKANLYNNAYMKKLDKYLNGGKKKK